MNLCLTFVGSSIGYVPDLCVVECEGDDVVEHEVRVLQRDPAAAPGQDDEVQYSTVQYSTVQYSTVQYLARMMKCCTLGSSSSGEGDSRTLSARVPGCLLPRTRKF